MTKSAQVRARIQPSVKAEAEAVFKSLGISTSEAISIFMHQVIHRKGFPFSINIPNDETIAAIQATKTGKTRATNIEDLATQFNLE